MAIRRERRHLSRRAGDREGLVHVDAAVALGSDAEAAVWREIAQAVAMPPPAAEPSEP